MLITRRHLRFEVYRNSPPRLDYSTSRTANMVRSWPTVKPHFRRIFTSSLS